MLRVLKVSQNANHRLEVAVISSDYHIRVIISGTYQAKGVFAGRLIYEKTVPDAMTCGGDGMWWSMRWEAQNNRWEFNYDDKKIRGTIESESIVRGESTV